MPGRPDPAARRRLAALLAAAALSLVAGVAVGAGAGDDGGEDAPPGGQRGSAGAGEAPGARAEAGGGGGAAGARALAADAPELARQVGQLVVLRFDGTPPPAYVARALREGRASGVILFRENAPDAAALRRVVRDVQGAAGGRALVMTDQEGGAVRTLLWLPPERGQAALATVDEARASAAQAGRALGEAGVNVVLAPVADVARPGGALAGRAYPGDAAAVAERVGAAVRALGAAGVGATPKHFPGLGAAAANTDDAPVTIAAEDLEADLAPFRAAFAAGAPLVMVGHARYPALDAERVASQSPAVLRDLLRERLGFRGVAVTDSLEAAAVPQEPGAAAVASVAAGVDLVLTTGAGSHLDVVRALLRRARASAAFRARVAEAAARVEALRRELGLEAPQ